MTEKRAIGAIDSRYPHWLLVISVVSQVEVRLELACDGVIVKVLDMENSVPHYHHHEGIPKENPSH